MPKRQLKNGRESLSDREEELLKEAIGMYIKTGHPVASKAISAQIGGRLSPSSIRSTLGQLTKRGFLTQNHPSGGRIPTTEAYRYYIDHLLKPHPIPLGLRKRLEDGFYRAFGEEGKAPFMGVSKLLASLTKQAGLVVLKSSAFKGELITPQVGSEAWMIMAVIEKKLKDPPYEFVLSSLPGVFKGRMGLEGLFRSSYYSHRMKERFSFNKEGTAVFWAGLGNLASVPEFGPKEGLRQLLEIAEEREQIAEAVFNVFSSRKSRVDVLFSRHDLGLGWGVELSLVVCGYTSKKAGGGLLGIMGPVRMDYERVIPFITHAAGMLERTLPLDMDRWF